MPAASPIERGSSVAGQAGRASLAGGYGDAGFCMAALVRSSILTGLPRSVGMFRNSSMF